MSPRNHFEIDTSCHSKSKAANPGITFNLQLFSVVLVKQNKHIISMSLPKNVANQTQETRST